MNFLIWNCRGSFSSDFSHNFRELLDMHKPALIVLLETHEANHQSMSDEFPLFICCSCPAEGLAGVIVILWQADLLNATNVDLTYQKMHCMI